MADNVVVTAGTGTIVHADEYTHGTLGSGKTQLVKLVDGTLDSGTPIAVDMGVKANALRVCPANDITDATYIGDIKFGEALPTGSNAIGKLAANSGVDIGDVTLTAGTAAIGKLAANSGVDIGDVDVTSIISGTAATNLGKARDSALGATDTGVMALAVRDDTLTTLTPVDGDYVPLRVGSTGKLHVTDANITACNTGAVVLSSGTVTTVSTVTAVTSLDKSVYVDDADWTDNTSSHTLVGGIYQSSPHTVTDGDVSPFQLDVNGKLITIAELSATDNAVLDAMVVDLAAIEALLITIDADTGTIDADTGAIKLAVEIMDDWDATHASAASADGLQVMGAAYSTALPTDVGADGDAARICTDRYGRILRGLMPQNFQATFTSADATSAAPVKVKTVSRKMYILSLVASVDTAMNVQFQDDTGPTVLIEGMYFAANGGCHLTWPPEAPLVVNTNEDFDVITSAAGNISVTITGYLAV